MVFIDLIKNFLFDIYFFNAFGYVWLPRIKSSCLSFIEEIQVLLMIVV